MILRILRLIRSPNINFVLKRRQLRHQEERDNSGFILNAKKREAGKPNESLYDDKKLWKANER